MTSREFWQHVYVAAIRAGLTCELAQRRADQAVEDLAEYDQLNKPVVEKVYD